jgi:hypothetical protein
MKLRRSSLNPFVPPEILHQKQSCAGALGCSMCRRYLNMCRKMKNPCHFWIFFIPTSVFIVQSKSSKQLRIRNSVQNLEEFGWRVTMARIGEKGHGSDECKCGGSIVQLAIWAKRSNTRCYVLCLSKVFVRKYMFVQCDMKLMQTVILTATTSNNILVLQMFVVALGPLTVF